MGRDAIAKTDSLEQFATRKLDSLARRKLRRVLTTTDRFSDRALRSNDTELISLACNDYLGLSHHPAVVAASIAATRRYGAGAGASRLITGNHPIYRELEQRLAAIKQSEDALVFGSGYLTNIGVIPVLAGVPDLIVMDELCHSCLLSGARLSRAKIVYFKHNDAADASRLLARHRDDARHCLLITEGVFSMEGDLAPLALVAELAHEFNAWLMSDDAHGLGVIGEGRGSTFAHATPVDVPLQMGTLSKAVGGYGGYLCASRNVVDLIRNRARSFVFSTGLPPASVAGALAAMEIIASDSELVAKPLARAQLFTENTGLPRAESPIVPLLLGSAERALKASLKLRDAGFLVPAIRPPTVPTGTSRLRFAFSAQHREQDVLRLAELAAQFVSNT